MQEALKLPASIFKTGLQNHQYRCNLLLHAYAINGALSHAHDLLLLMPQPNLVSYNTLLSGYVRRHQINDALELFGSMPLSDARSWNTIISGLVHAQLPEAAISHFICMTRTPVRPDNFTYASIIPCTDLGTGRQMHGQIVRVCSGEDAFISTNLVKMYAEAGEMGDAAKVFEEMPQRDLVSWNLLISCYSKFGMGDYCLQLFRRMIGEGWRVDEFTYATVLKEFTSCLQVFEGMQVHSMLVRSGFGSYLFTCNALLDLYCKCGFLASAAKLFGELPEQDVVSWTVLITGFAASRYESYALDAFHRMRMCEVEPNSFSFGSLISSFASSNSFVNGKRFHGLSLKFGLEYDVVVGSALVDMYSKCADMNAALRLFKSLPVRDLVSWNVIICGLAQNGEALLAMTIYDELVQLHQSGISPNNVTFIGVLSACSHGGFAYKGICYFSDMVRKFLIKPQPEHFACMVDLMARAGLLSEAETTILSTPSKSEVMWSTLLGACRRHGDLAMAKRVAERLFLDEPMNSSSFVLLANMYTTRGEWNLASDVREAMCVHGSKKETANSWIEIRGEAHSFTAGCTSHPQSVLVFELLHGIWIQMSDECNDGELIQ